MKKRKDKKKKTIVTKCDPLLKNKKKRPKNAKIGRTVNNKTVQKSDRNTKKRQKINK